MESPAGVPGVTIRAYAGGETASLVREKDWDATALGPRASWSRSLVAHVEMILVLPTPAIIFWGADHIQIYNAGYSVIMGPRHPQHLGSTYAECWPDTYPTISPWMRRVLTRGDIVEVDRALIPVTRYGYEEAAHFSFTFSPLRDDDGTIRGVLQLVTEMTEVVIAERRERTVRALALENDPHREDGILHVDALRTNPEDLAAFEVHLVDAGGLTVFARSDAALEDVAAGVALDAFQTGVPVERDGLYAVPVRASAGGPSGALVVRPNRNLRFDDAYRRFLEALGRQLGVRLVAQREHAARLEIEREREKLAAFFEQAPLPLCILSAPDYRFESANESFVRVAGRPVVGRTIAEAFRPEEAAAYIAILDRIAATGEPVLTREAPLRLGDADGGTHDYVLDVGYHPIRGLGGGVERIMAFIVDVTAQTMARRRVEGLLDELRTAVRARDEFLSIASHELRTPLTSMKLNAEVARRRLALEPDATAERMVLATTRGLDRMARLIDDMLDISRIQSGRMKLDCEEVDLVEIVREVVERMGALLASTGTMVHVEAEAPVRAFADRVRIEQVLGNLLTNAARYAALSPVTVSVDRLADRSRIDVTDRGPGIDPSDHERVFARFERGISPNEVSGLGLGLYIGRQIIEAHGGTLRLESALGEGARFCIDLPDPS